MKKYNPIKCAVCKEDFTPRSGRTLYCDKCRAEVDRREEYEGEQVCVDCILESLKKVEID